MKDIKVNEKVLGIGITKSSLGVQSRITKALSSASIYGCVLCLHVLITAHHLNYFEKLVTYLPCVSIVWFLSSTHLGERNFPQGTDPQIQTQYYLLMHLRMLGHSVLGDKALSVGKISSSFHYTLVSISLYSSTTNYCIVL